MKIQLPRVHDPLDDLIEPSDQPEEELAPANTLPMRFGPDIAIPWTIVRSCLRQQAFTLASVFQHSDLVDQGFKGWECVALHCGRGEGGMRLWVRDGFFLPCRENAAKALRRVPEMFLKCLAECAGFKDLQDLVNTVNRLPSGFDFPGIKPE